MSRDIKWLNRFIDDKPLEKETETETYFEVSNSPSPIVQDVTNDGEGFDEMNINPGDDNSDDESTVVPIPTKVNRALSNLRTFYNPIPEVASILYDESTPEGLHLNPRVNIEKCFVSAVESTFNDPKTYREAMNSTDKAMWKQAIKKEIESMKNRNVWNIIDKNNIPPDKKPIGTKWVFKKKQDGIY